MLRLFFFNINIFKRYLLLNSLELKRFANLIKTKIDYIYIDNIFIIFLY